MVRLIFGIFFLCVLTGYAVDDRGALGKRISEISKDVKNGK